MAIRILEYVRSKDGFWNLPGHLVDAMRKEFPEVEFYSARDRDDADRGLMHADAVLGPAVNAQNLPVARKLRWIHVLSAAVNGIAFPALADRGITLTNARGLHAEPMAEHVMGVILGFHRKLHLARDAQAKHDWAQMRLWREPPEIGGLWGATLGIVGFGAIGAAVARVAKPFGMRVLALRRRPSADPAPADAQWGPERLGDLLAQSDVVVLAPPLTPRTEGMVGRAQLGRMKRNALLVNVGRGALVDEAALIDALRHGRLAGAALDVTLDEPLPATSPLWDMPNIILTPHISGLRPRYWEEALVTYRSNLRAFLEGRPLQNVVDVREGY